MEAELSDFIFERQQSAGGEGVFTKAVAEAQLACSPGMRRGRGLNEEGLGWERGALGRGADEGVTYKGCGSGGGTSRWGKAKE